MCYGFFGFAGLSGLSGSDPPDFGGVGVAGEILGRDLMRAFHAGEVIADRAALPEHGPDWDPFMVCRRHAVKKRRADRVPTPA